MSQVMNISNSCHGGHYSNKMANWSLAWPLAATLAVVGLAVMANGLLWTMFRTLTAQRKLKRDSRGLNMLPGFSLLDGHLRYYNTGTMDLRGPLFEQLHKLGKNILCMMGRHPALVTIDLDLVKKFAIDEQRVHTTRSAQNFPLRNLTKDGIIYTKGDQWARIRKTLMPAMSGKRVKSESVTGQLERSLDKLIGVIEAKLDASSSSILAKTNGGPCATLNADDYMHRFTTDIQMNCFYGQDNVIDFKADRDPLVDLFDWGHQFVVNHPWVPLFLVIDFIDFMWLLDWFVLHFTSFGSFCKRMFKFIGVQEKCRRDKNEREPANNKWPTPGNNLMDPVVDSYHEARLTRDEMSQTLFSLVLAGDKSIANPLALGLYLLASHPDIQEKLRKSVGAYGRDCEYLGWVVNEVLRLMPSVSLGCSRTLERDIETSAGCLVPKGTFVLTPLNIIHRLEEFWGPDGDEFRPERFERQHEFHACQFMPFGMGARICPAKELSLHTIKLTLIKLLTRYKMSVDQKKQDDGYASVFFIFSVANETNRINFERIAT